MTGVCKCLDPLIWLNHLCRSPTKLQGPLLDNSGLFEDLIFRLRESTKTERSSPPKLRSKSLYRHILQIRSRNVATVAWDFSFARNSDAADLHSGPISPRYYWDPIESETMCANWKAQQDGSKDRR